MGSHLGVAAIALFLLQTIPAVVAADLIPESPAGGVVVDAALDSAVVAEGEPMAVRSRMCLGTRLGRRWLCVRMRVCVRVRLRGRVRVSEKAHATLDVLCCHPLHLLHMS